MIDEEEYNELVAKTENIDPYTGKVVKYHMDKFYGKDMYLPKMSEEDTQEAFRELENDLDIDFTFNNKEFCKDISAIPLVEQRPAFFSDKFAMSQVFRDAEVAETKMNEADKLAKKKRKDRLKLFDNNLKEFLNTECNANYKIKYDK